MLKMMTGAMGLVGVGAGAATSLFGSVFGAGGALLGGAASLVGGAAHLGASVLGRGGKKRAAGGGPVPFQGGAAGGGPAAGKATPRPAPAATSGAKPSGMIVTQVDPSSEDAAALILLDIRRILNAMSGDIASMKAQSIKKPFEGAVDSLRKKDTADAKGFRRGILRALVPKTTAGKALGATALLALLPVIAGMMSQLFKNVQKEVMSSDFMTSRPIIAALELIGTDPELINQLKAARTEKDIRASISKNLDLLNEKLAEEKKILAGDEATLAKRGPRGGPAPGFEFAIEELVKEGQATVAETEGYIAQWNKLLIQLNQITGVISEAADNEAGELVVSTKREKEVGSAAAFAAILDSARNAKFDDGTPIPPLEFFDPNKKLSLIEAQQAHKDKLIQDRFNAAKKVLGRRPGHLLPYQRKESIEGPRPPMKEFEHSGMLEAIIDDPEGEILDQTWAQKIAHAMRLAETRRISSRQKKAYETRPDAPESDVTIEPLEGPFPSWYPPVPPKQVFTTPRGTPGSVADLEVLPKFVEETRKALGDDTDLDNIAVQANITGKSLNNLLVDRIIDNLLKEQVTTKAGDIVYAPTIDSSTTVAGSGGGSGVSLQTRDVGRRVYENSAWNTRRQAFN